MRDTPLENTAISTLCDSGFLVGLRVMLFTLSLSNPWAKELPIEIFWTDSQPVPDRIKKLCSQLGFTRVNWRCPNLDKYNGILVGEPNDKENHGSYYKYEIFTLDEYKKVIFLDADVIVIGDLSELLQTNDGLGAVNELEIPQFNTGVLTIGEKFLGTDFRDELLSATGEGYHPHVDQDVINHVIGSDYTELPIWYNVLKSYYRHMGSWSTRTKVVHYIADKPWQQEKTRGNAECVLVEGLWHAANSRLAELENQEGV